jgi:hypothetical protein
MKEERLWMFQEAKMLKTKTSLSGTNMAESTSNGMLSTLTNGRVNQRRENSTKTSVFMLRDHSTFGQDFQTEELLNAKVTMM